MRVGARERSAHVRVVHVVVKAHPLQHAAVVGLVLEGRQPQNGPSANAGMGC